MNGVAWIALLLSAWSLYVARRTALAQTEINVAVKVHEAIALGTGQPGIYVNITNHSLGREVEVTHVWLEHEGAQVAIMNLDRPLPKRLRVGESWETWVAPNGLAADFLANVFEKGRVRLSTGKVLTSTRNTDVPGIGYVPGAQP